MKLKIWMAIAITALCLLSCTKKADMPLSQSDVIVAFGDSLTFGYGAPPASSYPAVLEDLIGLKVINEGVNGNTTLDGLKRIDRALDTHKPRLVLLSLGGNDLLRRLPEEGMKNNLKQLVDKIKQAGAIPVLVSQPQPSLIGVGLIGLSDAACYKVLAKSENLLLVENTFSTYLSKSEYKSDLIHLNAQGYAHVAKDIARALRRAGHVR